MFRLGLFSNQSYAFKRSISLDRKLSFVHQSSSSCVCVVGAHWDYPRASETSSVSTGMDEAPAARKPECAASQKGSPWQVCSPGGKRPAALLPCDKEAQSARLGEWWIFPSTHVVVSETLLIPNYKGKGQHFLSYHYGKRKSPQSRYSPCKTNFYSF